MLYFENDYCEGAHPAILQKLTETNFEKVSGYGTDPYCASAREKIRAACACPDADVTFISGGTQTNAIVIASMLQRWQGVLAAVQGQLEVKDRQIEQQAQTITRLTDALAAAQQTAAAAQALHAGTIQQQLITGEAGVDQQGQKPAQRRSWFNKLFRD